MIKIDTVTILVGLVLTICAASAVTMIACASGTPEEFKARAAAVASESIVTVSPRPGVECYVLRGSSSVNTQTMSCVVLPR